MAGCRKEDGNADLENEKLIENLTILKNLVDTNCCRNPRRNLVGWNGEAFCRWEKLQLWMR